MISALKPKPASRRNKPVRKVRGENPRGPKPKACDLCQLRKVKCDKAFPRCSLCQKKNRPCTYDRDGFSEPSSQSSEHTPDIFPSSIVTRTNSGSKFIKLTSSLEHKLMHSVVHQSLMAKKSSHVIVGADGKFIYVGLSMATHYLTRNQKLLSSISKPFTSNYEPVVYNRSISIDITHTLTLQLIELYFAYINSFFPYVNPTQFYSQLHQGCSTPSFKALLSVICLSGASFYPNRTFGRIIAIHFAKQATQFLRAIMLKPSIQALQAFLITSLHISVCEENSVIEGTWLTMGVAKSMAALLGLSKVPPKSSHSSRDLRERLYWLIFVADVAFSHCCGRPLANNDVSGVPLPSYDSLLPNVNVTCPSVFLIPEAMSYDQQSNQNYFRNFCAHLKLTAKRIRLQERYEEQDSRWNSISKSSFSSILNPVSSPNRPYLDGTLFIEKQSISWYQALPNVGPKIRRNPSSLYLPSSTDVHMSLLSVYFFSFLVDLNKPFISEEMEIAHIPYGRALNLTKYLKSNALEKCVSATFYGYQVLYNSGNIVIEVSVPYVWHAITQFIFFFVYIACKFPPTHWAVQPAIQNALFLFTKFEQNADRLALIRDSYFMIKPFAELLKIRSNPNLIEANEAGKSKA